MILTITAFARGGGHPGGSYWQAAKHTLFHWTNETANAWTSIVALLVVHVLYFHSRSVTAGHRSLSLLIGMRYMPGMHDPLLPAGCSTASRRPSWCFSYPALATCPSPSSAASSLASQRQIATSGGSWTCSSFSAAQVLVDLMHVRVCSIIRSISRPRPACSAARRGHWLERAECWGMVGVHGSPAAGLHLLHLLHHVQRSIKDIPRRELVWDIAGICAGACVLCSLMCNDQHACCSSDHAACAGYTFPMLLASLGEMWTGELGQATVLWAGVAACLGVSAYVCSQHIPEKWYPGTFDIVNSHAIMHVLVTVEYCLEWTFIRNGIIVDGLWQTVQ